MADKKITLVRDVRSGDWEGVYVDGVLLRQDHSIDGDDLLTVLGIEYEHVSAIVESGGRLPVKLEDVMTEEAFERQAKLDKAEELRREADELEAAARADGDG